LATATIAVAVFVVRLGTTFVAVAVAVSAILVPEAVAAFTCSTRLKLATALRARLAAVQVMVPAAPTAGVVHVQPAGAVIDWKFVFGGVV
jgi:hypothetical protein